MLEALVTFAGEICTGSYDYDVCVAAMTQCLDSVMSSGEYDTVQGAMGKCLECMRATMIASLK